MSGRRRRWRNSFSGPAGTVSISALTTEASPTCSPPTGETQKIQTNSWRWSIFDASGSTVAQVKAVSGGPNVLLKADQIRAHAGQASREVQGQDRRSTGKTRLAGSFGRHRGVGSAGASLGWLNRSGLRSTPGLGCVRYFLGAPVGIAAPRSSMAAAGGIQ